ncbi:MAG: hypothetical protein COW30_05230 [Rhodospirillales bacterium CG15_BIG_FIL_POST_REV_8_21_14_020_66_15]|nr:MAG: hypothetical protein COW30_05230 [Rhodospirillales bacterium CG15_BIG_FIL_POST_REV_8_21_14_020_66_15]
MHRTIARTAARVLSGAVIFLLTAIASAPADQIDVRSVPVALHAGKPDLTTIGRLKYRGGVELLSPSDRFGGFSALGLSADGKRMVALSDEGARFDAHLVYGPDGNLTGVTNTEIFILTGPGGVPLMDKSMADAEAMAPGVEGEIIVAFERSHRLWAYPPNKTGPRPLPLPNEMRKAPANNGIEALALLGDGSLFAVSEGLGRDGANLAWISDRKGWSVLIYRNEDNYRPTGAATLPGGDVVLVERYFSPREGVRARVRRIKAAGIRPAAEISGDLLAELRDPLTVDNFEGIEAIKGPKGETLIFLISDDNFKRRGPQKTLLMMFELTD